MSVVIGHAASKFERGTSYALRSLGAAVVGAVAVAAGLAASAPAPAGAATYRIRTYSIGRATQTYRPDRTANARRIFTQGLDLRAYNLLGTRRDRLRAVVNARYTTDFALRRARADDPLYADQWNDTALRLAYLRWQVADGLELRFGRQWSRGTLGIRDFDGIHAEFRPRLDPSTRAVLALYAGHDVELAGAPFNTDDFDVQGLPATNEDDVSPVAPRPGATPWIAGGRVGLDWGDLGGVTFGYRKRWRSAPGAAPLGPTTRTGSERLGVGLSAVPHDRLTVSAAAAYHATLSAVDRASLELAWDVPDPLGTLTTGVAHRRPWFDSSSIFNLFGTRPHQGAHLVYQQGVPELRTEFELRQWGRIYRGDSRATGLRRTARKTTRLGIAAAHSSDVSPFGHAVDWDSQLSVEADTRARESTHVLADTRARTPVVFEDFYVTARLLFLAAAGHSATAETGTALTWVLGFEVPVAEVGTFQIAAERTDGTFAPSTTNLFATLELEVWR